ncbi:uncharacterized protein N7482_005165 [Penicillium canariense]|uniref:Store-operated calcium entry-associated regulatory factor n=1 Tax=Penicillium canariense TaxID=189055 RepID=A0A9W9I4G0_9EURO|nr:uncharacterized protein N7482_005165 [Penicillium canariense]KAJ5166384.1 hypothetical protein N7482_005165 [Penicillium canariense]
MHWLAPAVATLLLSSPAVCDRSQKPPGKDAILLSNVQALTLRANRETTSRRVSAIPQLSCIGPSKKICDLYQIEVMRCANEGYDYDAEDVQWTCSAPLPPEFKLGATDVVCEGYRNSEDKWVLKGSCGVEYRMLLTEQGEKRFGKARNGYDWSQLMGNAKKSSGWGWKSVVESIGDLIFFGIFAAVFLFIVGRMLADCFGLRRNRGDRTPGRRWGWGGGGGGGGGGDGYYPGPPPPYSSGCSDDSPSWGSGSRPAAQGWRPGFWTGAASGAAAAYHLGRRAANNNTNTNNYNSGEGSSQTRSSPSFSTTSTSTGFGSTRRR